MSYDGEQTVEDKIDELKKYIDWFLSNYEMVYNSYKDEIYYYDFNNWKDIVIKILD